MKWRKWNRWLHRELGFIFFGMAIIYGISGIALNHGVARHWNPGIVTRTQSFTFEAPLSRASVNKETIKAILEMTKEADHFKQYYFPSEDHLMIYLQGGHIIMTLSTGDGSVTKIRKRPVFKELNYLHYNKPKKLWTWFSDMFALALILLAISGPFMVHGKKGMKGQGTVQIIIGVIVPLLLLTIYLWL